ncbi:MAG: response regulator [Sphingomonadales bacterium]|nr:response regulator [Sphingomonadales bacterium]
MIFSRRKPLIRRLLIVEDEPLVAFDNEHFLTAAGYEVLATVDNAEDAIAALSGETDLVVLDLNIAGEGSGIDVAKAARDKGIPVVFVTGACPHHAKGYALGCLAKPYRDKDLIATIKALDRVIAGEEPGKLPDALTLFAAEEANEASD